MALTRGQRNALWTYPAVYLVPALALIIAASATDPRPHELGFGALVGVYMLSALMAQIGYMLALQPLYRRMSRLPPKRLAAFAAVAAVLSLAASAALLVMSAGRYAPFNWDNLVAFLLVPVALPMLVTWVVALLLFGRDKNSLAG
jgi:uncharacterized BrkB/YihY/UPF0761 family membrane protein